MGFKRNKIRALDGTSPLAYVGVNPTTPPNIVEFERRPTPHDFGGFIIGDHWTVNTDHVLSSAELWFLWDKSEGVSTWLQIAMGGSGFANKITTIDDGNVAIPVANNWNFDGINGIQVLTPIDEGDTITFGHNGTLANNYVTDNGTAIPSGGTLNVLGGDNVNTAAIADLSNNLYVNLNKSLHLPKSNASGTEGVWYTDASSFPLSGGNPFISNIGTNNTFVGELSGNLTLTTASAQKNSSFGALSLADITTGSDNTTGGYLSGTDISTGGNNTLYGSGSGQSITTLNNACAFGSNALFNLVDDTGLGERGPVAIGFEALSTATTQSDNQPSIAIGQWALRDAVDAGKGNVAIGLQTLQNYASAAAGSHYNTACGHSAMETFVSGIQNTAYGARAMNHNNATESIVTGKQLPH